MSTQFNVAGLLKESVGSTRQYEIDGEVSLDPDVPPKHVSGTAVMLRTPRGLLVSANLSGWLIDSCARCLQEVSRPLEFTLEEEFVQSLDIDTGARAERTADPDDFRIDVHHVVDLKDAIRQYWAAALPLQTLCAPDCRGLCQTCGANLNDAPHACAREPDERWSALQELAANVEGS